MLAPTASDLSRHGKEGTVFAGYHYDLNFLTIHGRSRFPGLYIWLRNGQKVEVRVPVGCLLLQAGKQVVRFNFSLVTFINLRFIGNPDYGASILIWFAFAAKQLEWLTGGDCLAGMHEVVVTKRTLAAIEAASQARKSLWRVIT